MLHRQKAEGGNGKLDRGPAHHFAAPADFDEWHSLAQVNQVRAIATGVEHGRSHWPRCAGTVLRQLNDCWPVTSWAALDGDEREKPLYHGLKRLYADRLLTFQRRDGATVLAAVNQGGAPWACSVLLRRLATDGTELARHRVPVEVAPRSATVPLPASLGELGDATREFWAADGDGLRALRFARPDADLAYPAAGMAVSVTSDGDSAESTVTARTLLRDLLLQADRRHPRATTDRGLLTLLPGESTTFRVQGWDGTTTPETLARALRCVNSARATAPAGATER